jgi:beta-lactamase class A
MHITRRSVLRTGLIATGTTLLSAGSTAVPTGAALSPSDAGTALPPVRRRAGLASSELQALEAQYDARLGVYARNLRTGAAMLHRQHERFAMCSTFKPIAAAAVLRDSGCEDILDRRIYYPPADIVVNSPITAQHVDDGMTVRELCDAAIRFSDNTAGNLLLRLIGGPVGLTRFARSIGDRETRLDRWEVALNSAIPGDPRDTTTPAALAATYVRLVFGNRLIREWMLANQTSFTRFRAGLPEGWTLADKTGGGDYGSVNDAGVAWNPDGVPIVIVALSVKSTQNATADNRLLADVARLVARTL